MTDTGRTKATRRARRGGSQAIVAALILLGVVASVILLLTDSVQWLRVGIVIALWAAIVGAFAMTKYRRDSTADQVKARDLQTVYELQLEREIAARREYELGVEARVRGEIGGDSSELIALRLELASLRRSLEMLFDGALPEDRAAIAGEAMRMRELADRSYSGYQPAPSGLYVRAPYATPADEPVTAETSVIHGDFDSASSFRSTSNWTPDLSTEIPDREIDSAPDENSIPDYDTPFRRPAPFEATPYEATPYRSDEVETYEPVSFDEPAQPVATQGHTHTDYEGEGRPESTPDYATADYSTPEFSMPGVTIPEYSIADRSTPDYSTPDYPASGYPAEPEPPSTPDADVPASDRRSRRRAAESEPPEVNGGAHSSGRSVADILAGIGGSSENGQAEVGRRRRRAE